jgi:hypothetical protein
MPQSRLLSDHRSNLGYLVEGKAGRSMIENEFLSYRISKHANSFNFGFY